MGQSKNQFMEERELETTLQDGHYVVQDEYLFWEEYVKVKGPKVVKVFRSKEKPGIKRREVELQMMTKESYGIIQRGDLVPIEESQFSEILTEAIGQMNL